MLVGLYWLAVGNAGWPISGSGFRFLVAIFTGFWLGAALYPVVARRVAAGAGSFVVVVALGLALFSLAGPWLLNDWIRGDFDRYVWVIHQAQPCSGMGGGPGMLWVFGTSWLAAFAAFVYAATFPLTVHRVAGGLGFGVALLLATAAAMFPDPSVFARVLGCV